MPPKRTVVPTTYVPTFPSLTPNQVLVYVGGMMSNNIYYSDSTNKLITLVNDNSIQNISGSNKKYFGIDIDGLLWYNSDYTSTNWTLVPTPPSQPDVNGVNGLYYISYDGYTNVLMAITTDSKLYYADTNITTNPNWTLLTNVTNVINVSISNKQVFVIDSTFKKLLYSADYKLNNYTNINIPLNDGQYLDSVTFDGYNNVIMILCHNKVGTYMYYADTNITTNPNWTLAYMPLYNGIIDSPINITLSNNQVVAVSNSGYIYYNPSYKSYNWVTAIATGSDSNGYLSFDAKNATTIPVVPIVTPVPPPPSIPTVPPPPPPPPPPSPETTSTAPPLETTSTADAPADNTMTIVYSIIGILIVIAIIAVVYFKFIKKDGNNKLVEKGGYYYFND